MRKMLFALAAQSLVASAGLAIDPPRRLVAPIVPCPPVVMPTAPCPPGTTPSVPGTTPGTPTTPPTTPTTPPGTPPTPPPVVPDVSDAFARQSEGGSQASATFAPTMFGDVIGARSIRLTYNASAVATFGRGGGVTLGDGTPGFTVTPTPSGTISFTDASGRVRPTVNLSQVTGANLDFAQPLLPDGSLDTVFAQQAIQFLLSRTTSAEQLEQFNRLTPDQRAQLVRNRGQINRGLTQTLNGLTVPAVAVTRLSGSDQGDGTVRYDLGVQASANVTYPGGSTYVGRVKASEDTSPLPRDRFIFTYDHFDNVPLTTSGFTVNRYQFGIEKTFLDGRWSAEFRLPFAGTVGSTNVQGFEVSHAELGNVRFALKRIFSQNQVLTTTSGVAVTLPTAADQLTLSALDGDLLYRFDNEQVTVEPFVAALFYPNDRLFSQTWASLNFDVSGGLLTWDPAVFGGSGRERIVDVPFLAVDHQVGYWLIRNDVGTLRGLAPFVELHWNYAIAQDEFIGSVASRTSSNGLVVDAVATHELNMIAGVNTLIGDNLNLSIGVAAPLLRRPDRTFDAQVGVRANYLFGRTARARNPIYSINTY